MAEALKEGGGENSSRGRGRGSANGRGSRGGRGRGGAGAGGGGRFRTRGASTAAGPAGANGATRRPVDLVREDDQAATPAASGSSTPTRAAAVSDVLALHSTQTRFDSFDIDPRITIPFEMCTDVQAKTMPIILEGSDVLAQAKTGTGKTIAFLVPAIQRLLRSSTKRGPGQVGILVISPTRELAAQIATEGEILIKNIPNFGISTATGGNTLSTELSKIRSGRADILVATPGRLEDYLKNHKFSQNVSTLDALILDETDRLLDQGFKPAIVAISKLLPDHNQRPRQSLLFSATISNDVKQVASAVLTSQFTFVSTLNEDELNVHQHVPQTVVQTSLPDIFATTVAVLREALDADADSKIMVFLPTARSTGLFYEILSNLPQGALGPNGRNGEGGFQVLQIHSRMSQSARTRSSDAFKAATSGILVSSDVTARGMDFPKVTLVVQTGIPQNAEQYIHRLGRTARAGKGGSGVLVLTPDEMAFVRGKIIKDLPIAPGTVDETTLSNARQSTSHALISVSNDAKSSAYAAWLGYYKGFVGTFKWTIPHLIEQARVFALETCGYEGGAGIQQTPPLLTKTVGMMGLKQYRSSFNIVSELPGKSQQQSAGGAAAKKRKIAQ